jgi:type II secretory pathway pseudopilin PulG
MSESLRLPGGARPGRRSLSISAFRSAAGFTVIELLLSICLLSFILLILASATESSGRMWRDGQSRTDSFQSARTTLELMARELTPAVVDTRTQFVTAPNTILSKVVKSKNEELAKCFAPESPAILWMAPLGAQGELCCVGYYLYRNEAKKFHRLKRIFITPKLADGTTSPYFPRTINPANPRDTTLRTSPVNALWFTGGSPNPVLWDAAAFDEESAANTRAVVSSAADGVIAFWVQSFDLLGNPIPLLSKAKNHPKSDLWFNSAAYFQAATTTKFEDGKSFVYLAETPQSIKANRVPAAVEITIVTLDPALLVRGVQVPSQVNVFDENRALDVGASVAQFQAKLRQNNIFTARTFATRVKLINGS